VHAGFDGKEGSLKAKINVETFKKRQKYCLFFAVFKQ
jgi:hypothetical protein